MDKYIGRTLADRYEVLELIGIGGMAYVYRAMDHKENRVVAVKILKDEYLANEEFIRRFRNESRAISLLSHPNIVKIYDVLFGEFLQIIVMEYIDGITLKEYIEHQHVLKWKEVVHFTVQILRALQHAHDKGIVHRDIKPQNIMLLTDGTIKVMDFGIARFARSDPQTMTDKAIGSVHYISPEQARGERIDEKTDIYSVGVMLFEMLSGELPFQGESPVSVALMQIQDLPKKPRDINPNIPAGLEYITLRAMQKDRARRYQSAAEMLRDLDAFKRDPAIVFAEDALDKDEPTRSFDAVDTNADYEEVWEKKSAVVPVLAGIAFAFVMATLLFVVGILYINNPFETVEDFEMPTLVGLDYDEATQRYPTLDIVVTERDYSETYVKGQIYQQSPRAGRSVKANSVITVSVSEGPRVIELSDYVNLDAELVEKTLKDLDLVPIITEEVNSEVTIGFVIRTNPEARTMLKPGDTVELIVSASEKKDKTNVPDIKDMKISDAIRLLESYGLKLGDQKAVESDKPAGTIVSQSPEADMSVDEGTSVSVEISAGGGEGSAEEDDSGPVTRLIVRVPLPTENLPESYRLTVTGNQKEIANETIVPSEYPDGYLKVTFEDRGTKQYVVLIDGYAYLTIEVYYNETAFAVVEGTAGQFDFSHGGTW